MPKNNPTPTIVDPSKTTSLPLLPAEEQKLVQAIGTGNEISLPKADRGVISDRLNFNDPIVPYSKMLDMSTNAGTVVVRYDLYKHNFVDKMNGITGTGTASSPTGTLQADVTNFNKVAIGKEYFS